MTTRTTRMVLKLNLVPLSLTLLRPLPLSGTVRPEFLMIVLNLMAKNRRDLSLARQELTLQLEGLVSARPAPLLISPPMGLSALLPPQPHFPAHQPGCQSFKKFRSLSFIFRKKLLVCLFIVFCYDGFPYLSTAFSTGHKLTQAIQLKRK